MKTEATSMPRWKATVDIKTVLATVGAVPSKTECAEAANKIATLLKDGLPASLCDDEIDGLIEELEATKPDVFDDDPSYSVQEDVNHMLERLYDWADQNRVWLGA